MLPAWQDKVDSMYPYTIYNVCVSHDGLLSTRTLFSDNPIMGDTLSMCSKLPHSVAGIWEAQPSPPLQDFSQAKN